MSWEIDSRDKSVVDFRMEMEQTKEGISSRKRLPRIEWLRNQRGLRNLIISNLADRIETRSKLSMVERARNSGKEREETRCVINDEI